MSTAVGSYRQQVPIRKPVPQFSNSPSPHQARSSIVPDHAQPYTHTRARTASSSVFPPPARSATAGSNISPTSTPVLSAAQPSQRHTTRRTLSNATSSTTSSSRTNHMQTTMLQRAPSTASSTNTTTGISYVAQMRKQKATVWCERSQFEDPRILAQQRAAKARAAQEVVGGKRLGPGAMDDRTAKGGNRMSTASSTMGGVRSKIRHHPKATLTPANMAGAGVPMRLSASEVDEGDDEQRNAAYGAHQRSGSGRSSFGSGRRISGFTGSYSLAHNGPRYSISNHSSTPSSIADVAEVAEETPVAEEYGKAQRGHADYFQKTQGRDTGSISSGERENSFGQLGTMHEMPKEERETADDLRRRGSVDERTTTMTGQVRLFVANPDLSD
jgi:hypothetical protein